MCTFQLDFKLIQPLQMTIYLFILSNFKIIPPLLNRSSDHEAHRIKVNDINLKIQTSKPKNKREISKYTATDFIITVTKHGQYFR